MQCNLRLNQLFFSRSNRYSHNRSSSKPHPTGLSFSTRAPRQQQIPEDSFELHSRSQSCHSVGPSLLQSSCIRQSGWLSIAAAVLVQSQLFSDGAGAAATELVEANISNEGNVPSKLSAAGEQAGPSLSSLVSGTNKKQIEGCTRKCVPTCTRGGEGAPGLGPISLRKEIVVFKDGFRSRQYCLSECAQVCSLISRKAGDSSGSDGNDQGRASTAAQEQQSGIPAAAPVP